MKTAVEFYREELNTLVSLRESRFKTESEIFKQALEMEKRQKIKAQIEILRKIGNNGPNAPLYGILKTALTELEQELKSGEDDPIQD